MNKYLDDFMKAFPYEGLTYDDVTLVTQYADFLPDDTSLETKLTSRTKMKVPFMSAAMDTVTEAPMAIAMALAGGIGCIHKNLEEDEQAAQVRLVKNHLNGMIENPVCFHSGDETAVDDVKRIPHFQCFHDCGAHCLESHIQYFFCNLLEDLIFRQKFLCHFLGSHRHLLFDVVTLEDNCEICSFFA